MKNKLHFALSSSGILALALCIFSCDRESNLQELPQPLNGSNAATNIQLESVAKKLAKTFGENASMRTLLKAEALKKSDGDYDVLYSNFVQKSDNFGQLMKRNSSTQESIGVDMNAVLQDIPNLNISVPVNIEKWNTTDFSPLVLYIPAGYNERSGSQELRAFDKNGNVHILDAKKAPDFPVIVVGPSERVAKDGKIKSNLVDLTLPSTKQQLAAKGKPTDAITNMRTNLQTEHLRGMMMRDVSYYESWFLGDPEVHLRILAPVNGFGGSTTLYDATFVAPRSKIDNKPWQNGASLFYWDTNMIGNTVQYVWIEDDGGGGEISVTLGISYKMNNVTANGSVSYKYHNDDDVIGTLVNIFEVDPREYSLGGGSAYFIWGNDHY